MLTIRSPTQDDLDACVALLAAAKLPTADLTADRLALVAEEDGRVVAAVGLEQFGALGLLRSLVVDSTRRSDGLGEQLVRELESLARLRGVRELWLLTIDADAYFQRHGYDAVSRDQAPDAIRSTEEFSSLCPGDAVLMRKRL